MTTALTHEQAHAEHMERCRAVQRRSRYNRLRRVIAEYESDHREWIRARLPDLYNQLAKVAADMQAHGQR